MIEKITLITKTDLNNENFLKIRRVEKQVQAIKKIIAVTLPQNKKGLLLDMYM